MPELAAFSWQFALGLIAVGFLFGVGFSLAGVVVTALVAKVRNKA